MKNRHFFKTFGSGGLCTAIFSLMLLAFGGQPASAQGWPQGTITVNNNTDCPVTVCTVNGISCGVIPAHTSRSTGVICTIDAMGVQNCNTVIVPIKIGECATLNIGEGCCARCCFNTGEVACTFIMNVDPVPGPCPCPEH